MDDRDDLADLQARLAAMTEEEQAEARAFLARFNEQLARKVEQLTYELQDSSGLSEEALEMRARLLEGQVPLLADDGTLIYRKRGELSIQDMQRFAAFLDADAERRKRAIGDLGESSEN
jgi:hypothetical protein